MTWHILRDGRDARLIGDLSPDAELWRGTIVLEIDLAAFAASDGPLLHLSPRRNRDEMLSIETSPDGRMHLLHRQGREVSHVSVGLGPKPASGRMRLSYHWDARRGRSILTAENLGRGTIRQNEARCALRLRPDDLRALAGTQAGCSQHAAIDWLGVTDHWQTVGPVPGFDPYTPVETPTGPRAVATLRAGDLVLTADHGPLPLLWQGRIEAPSNGSLRLLRLGVGATGSDRPLVVRACQRIALSGTDVEYLFGEEQVLIEARHLVDGRAAHWAEGAAIRPTHGLLFDRPALVRAGGVWFESMYMGRITVIPELARSTAPGALVAAGTMPRHTAPVRREMRTFEAQALCLARQRSRSIFAA